MIELDYTPSMPVVARRAAESFADMDFVVTRDRRASFAEVELASRRMARQLLALGVGKGDRVAIQLLNSPDWVTAWLAVTRIGGLAMVLSTIYRPPELAQALRIGDVSVLVTSPTILGRDHALALEETIPALVGHRADRLLFTSALPYLRRVVLIGGATRPWACGLQADGDSEALDGVDEVLLEAVESQVSPADLMTAVFTSGTTAEPKAVVHTHGAVLRKTSPVSGSGLDGSYGGRILNVAPFFWVGGLQNVAGALQSGATLVCQERFDPTEALELVARERVRIMSGNPAPVRSITSHPDYASTDLTSLRERPFARPARVSSRGETPTPLGMTETMGIWASAPGFEVRVVDPGTGHLLGQGEPGEFHVRGYALMAQLYKREREATFDADGWYATGDRGYLEGGAVYFHGRTDDMIKCKGANVAPAEVERVLEALPGIRTVLVFGVPHPEQGQEVVAAVVPVPGEPVDTEAVRAEARTVLSPYKVPTRIVPLDDGDLRWLASSKIDRRAIEDIVRNRLGVPIR